MNDKPGPITLKLTEEQQQLVHDIFGQRVPELMLSVEEYGIEGAKDSAMKVLKVNNVARVEVAGIGNVVN